MSSPWHVHPRPPPEYPAQRRREKEGTNTRSSCHKNFGKLCHGSSAIFPRMFPVRHDEGRCARRAPSKAKSATGFFFYFDQELSYWSNLLSLFWRTKGDFASPPCVLNATHCQDDARGFQLVSNCCLSARFSSLTISCFSPYMTQSGVFPDCQAALASVMISSGSRRLLKASRLGNMPSCFISVAPWASSKPCMHANKPCSPHIEESLHLALVV